MLNIGRIWHQDRLLRATTGLNRRAFETANSKMKRTTPQDLTEKGSSGIVRINTTQIPQVEKDKGKDRKSRTIH
jgi:hypothetical protein